MMSITNIVLAFGIATTTSAVRLQSQSQSIFDDIGHWASKAADDTADWSTKALTDIGDTTIDGANKVGHWSEGAVNDVGKFFDKEGNTMVGAVTGVFTAEGIKKLGTALETQAEEGLATAAEAPIPA